MKNFKRATVIFINMILVLMMLSGCSNRQAASNQPNSSSSPTNASTDSEEQSSISVDSTPDLGLSDDPAEKTTDETYSNRNFFLISHATVSDNSVFNPRNDTPEDYFDVASPYESYSYYEDGSPLLHKVFYKEGGYYEERWEQDENGNVIMYEGRTGNDQIAYMYDDDNHLIQEWEHRNYWPSSVTIYGDYDKHGNYGSTEKITSWGGSLFKQGDPWYNLDYIDYEEVQSTTHYYYAHEYDEAGRLTSVVRTNHDGSKRSIHTYEYDSQGNLIYEYDSGDVYLREYHSNGEIALLQVKWRDQLKEEIVYDTHGNPISKFSELDYTGTITTYENEYDINGNLVRRFTYDEEGNCKSYDIWRYGDEETLSYINDVYQEPMTQETAQIIAYRYWGVDPDEAAEYGSDIWPAEGNEITELNGRTFYAFKQYGVGTATYVWASQNEDVSMIFIDAITGEVLTDLS